MSREWGIYPEAATPKMWWGARAIITKGKLEVLYDRQNFEGNVSEADDFFAWLNKTAIPKLAEEAKRYNTQHVFFDSDDGRFHCEAKDMNSGGYLYIGCWPNEK